MVVRVGSPEGTITHTTRGLASFWTSSSSVATSRAADSLRSNPTTVWPPRRSRSAMLPPILPSPMRPISTATSRGLASTPSVFPATSGAMPAELA